MLRNDLQDAAHKAGSRVVLLTKGQGRSTLNELYAACDCYISLHRSEGFGLNLAESMQMGRPTIATKWSGNMDFMDDQCSALVEADLIPVNDPDLSYNVYGTKWADPELNVAAKFLRKMAYEPDWRYELMKRAKIKIAQYPNGIKANLPLL